MHDYTEAAVHKDLELQIQFLEEQLASRRSGRRNERCSANTSSSVPAKVMKAKEQKDTKALSPTPSAAPEVKREDLHDAKENSENKISLSAEEATDRFIAELKQEISMRQSSGILFNITNTVLLWVMYACTAQDVNKKTENFVAQKDLTGTVNYPEVIFYF